MCFNFSRSDSEETKKTPAGSDVLSGSNHVERVGLSLGHLGGTLAQTAKEALAEGLGEAVGEGGMVGGGAVIHNLTYGRACSRSAY